MNSSIPQQFENMQGQIIHLRDQIRGYEYAMSTRGHSIAEIGYPYHLSHEDKIIGRELGDILWEAIPPEKCFLIIPSMFAVIDDYYVFSLLKYAYELSDVELFTDDVVRMSMEYDSTRTLRELIGSIDAEISLLTKANDAIVIAMRCFGITFGQEPDNRERTQRIIANLHRELCYALAEANTIPRCVIWFIDHPTRKVSRIVDEDY